MSWTKRSKNLKVKGRKYASGRERSVWIKRLISVTILSVAILFLCFAAHKGVRWMRAQLYEDNPRYEIQHLIIESNGTSCTVNNIREWSGVVEGMNLFAISLEEIENRLLKVSTIESVYLERICQTRLQYGFRSAILSLD